MHSCKEQWVDNRGFCSTAGVWTQQQQITCYQPALHRCKKARWADRQGVWGQNISMHSTRNVSAVGNVLGCFRCSLAFTCEQFFKLMSWECPLLFNRCRVTFSECERKGWGETLINLTKRWNLEMTRYTGKREVKKWGAANRWETEDMKSHVTCTNWGQTVANCRFSQVSFDFLWTNGIMGRGKNTTADYFSFLRQPVLNEFIVYLLNPQSQRNVHIKAGCFQILRSI